MAARGGKMMKPPETTLETLIARASQFDSHQRWKGERKVCAYRLPTELVDAVRRSAVASGVDINTFVVRALERAVNNG
jgi:predicted HicB family RNase H-like nuclease